MAGTGFKIGNPGDSCGCDCVTDPPPCVSAFTFTAVGCNGVRMPGQVITFARSGGSTYAGTTDSSAGGTAGQVVMSLPPGTYAVTSPAPTSPPGYNPLSTTITVTNACALVPFGGGLTFTPATGYTCGYPSCPPLGCVSGPPYKAPTYPAILFLEDGKGPTVTLTPTGSTAFGVPVWQGIGTRDRTDFGGVVTHNVPVTFTVQCQGANNQWAIVATYPLPLSEGGGTATAGYITITETACPPSISLVQAVTGNPPTGNNFYRIWGADFTWSVTN